MAKTDIKHYCLNCKHYRKDGKCSLFGSDTAALAAELGCFEDKDAPDKPVTEAPEDFKRWKRATTSTGGGRAPRTNKAPLSAETQDFEGLKAIGDYLGVCAYTVSKWIAAGQIEGLVTIQTNGRRLAYAASKATLDAFKAKREEAQTSGRTVKVKSARRKTTDYIPREDELAGTQVIADFLQVSLAIVNQMIKAGELKSHREAVNGTVKVVVSQGEALEALRIHKEAVAAKKREALVKGREAITEKSQKSGKLGPRAIVAKEALDAHRKEVSDFVKSELSKTRKAADDAPEEYPLKDMVIVHEPAPTHHDPAPARHLSDDELVAMLRARGWQVTCTKSL